MENLYSQPVINTNQLFGDNFLDAKNLYLYSFNKLPSINYMDRINGEKAFEAFKNQYSHLIQHIHQYRSINGAGRNSSSIEL